MDADLDCSPALELARQAIRTVEAQRDAAEQRACRAETALLALAPIAMPILLDRARDRLTANPPRSPGFDDAANHFAAALRLRQAIRKLEQA